MHRTCPECGLVFEREPGYFLGAMYLSYGLGILVAAPVALGLHLGLGVSVEVSAWSSGAVLVVASPWLFRSSRVGWLHFDQHFHPR